MTHCVRLISCFFFPRIKNPQVWRYLKVFSFIQTDLKIFDRHPKLIFESDCAKLINWQNQDTQNTSEGNHVLILFCCVGIPFWTIITISSYLTNFSKRKNKKKKLAIQIYNVARNLCTGIQVKLQHMSNTCCNFTCIHV